MPRKPFLRWLGLLLGLGVLGLVALRLRDDPVLRQLAWERIHWPWLAGSFVAFALSQAGFALAWHRLMRQPGRSIAFVDDAARWCLSLAGKYLPGKIWQPLARLGLYQGSARAGQVAPAYGLELMLTISAALTVVAVQAATASRGRVELALPLGLAAAVLALGCAPAVGRILIARLQRWIPLGLQMPALAGRELGGVWALQLLAYLALGLGVHLLGLASGLVPPGLAGPVIAAFCFGGMAGIAAVFVPAGLGVREAALAWYLSPWIGAGPAMLLALLARAWISLGEALLVLAGSLWLQRRKVG